MKALILTESKELNIQDIDLPSIPEGHALVKIEAAALNHRELWIAKGLYPGMKLPCILGADGAGKVTKVGSEEDAKWMDEEVIVYPGYDWGDNDDIPLKAFRVLGMPDPGTLAEYIAVPVSHLVKKPKYLSWTEAAAIPVAYLTAWRALTRHGKISSDTKVLITGIGGGVAQAGLSFAKAHGAKAYVTSSKEHKIEDAIAHGADGGVLYTSEDWPAQLKALSGGIDIVLDSSPLPVLDDYLRFLNTGARIVAYGSTGNRKTTVNISKFFLRHIQFIGTAMGSPREFAAMLDFMDQHKVVPRVDQIFEFAEVVQALDQLATGQQKGKIVVKL